MQSRDIYELLKRFFADGFTIENLCKITGISSELISRCIDGGNITQEETQILGRVVAFLGLLYMVNTKENSYLKESVSSLECFYQIPHEAIANYLDISNIELDAFLENPKDYPNGHDILLRLMHFKAVLLQKVE